MAQFLAKRIENGDRTLESVPDRWKPEVERILKEDGFI